MPASARAELQGSVESWRLLQGLADLRSDAAEEPFAPASYPMGLRAGHDPAHLGALGDDMGGGRLSRSVASLE